MVVENESRTRPLQAEKLMGFCQFLMIQCRLRRLIWSRRPTRSKKLGARTQEEQISGKEGKPDQRTRKKGEIFRTPSLVPAAAGDGRGLGIIKFGVDLGEPEEIAPNRLIHRPTQDQLGGLACPMNEWRLSSTPKFFTFQCSRLNLFNLLAVSSIHFLQHFLFIVDWQVTSFLLLEEIHYKRKWNAILSYIFHVQYFFTFVLNSLHGENVLIFRPSKYCI